MLFELGPVACGERQTIAVVDGPLGNLAHDLLKTRIVLVSARAVGLHDQSALSDGWRAAENLYIGCLQEDDGRDPGEDQPERLHRQSKGSPFRGAWPVPMPVQR